MFRSRTILPALGLAALVAALTTVPNPAGAQSFALRTDYATGLEPRGVVLRDVNGDGKPDLLIANTGGSSVSVLLGIGAGVFGAKTDFTVDSGPVALASGDFNGDGKVDLVSANSGTLTVLLGNGAGGFGARTDYGVSAALVVVADMTGDGRPDLVTEDITHVWIFPGNGTGGFGPPQSTGPSGGIQALDVGDLNGDGLMDLAIARRVLSTTTLHTLIANGSGGFTSSASINLDTNAQELFLVDLDGDGKLDVLTRNGSTLSRAFGNGSGGFGSRIDDPSVTSCQDVVLADVNNDGIADICDADGAGQVRILTGLGGGNYTLGPMIPAASDLVNLAVGDVNGDGQLDLVTANVGSNTVSVLLNTTVLLQSKTDFTTGSSPRWIATGDLNADGRPDLAVANETANTVSVLLGNGAGGFGAKTDLPSGATPTGVAIGDVTGDGKPDLVVANNAADSIAVLPGNGSGGFGTRTSYAVGAGASVFSVVLGDVNNDGRLDVLCTSVAANKLSVFLGNGAGGLGARTDFPTGANPLRIALGFVNGDANLDVVTANNGGNSVSVLLGTGTGSFGAKTDFGAGVGPNGVVLADVNGDGKLDLAVANTGSNSASVLLGLGTGAFAAKTDYTVGATPFTIAAGDANADGRLDLVVSNGGAANVSLLLGSGNGAFAPKVDLVTGNGPRGVALTDLNADGRLDLVAANAGSSTASVLLSLTPTRTALSIAPTTVLAGWPVTLTANVSMTAGSGTATGSVRFFDGLTSLGTATVSGGIATLASFAPLRGDRAVTAVYVGDGKTFGSTSNIATMRVVSMAAARVTGIGDVSSDQGGQVRLLFAPSPYDFVGSSTPITGYQVYRRSIVSGASQVRERTGSASAKDPELALAGWDYVLTVPATAEGAYQTVVPTLADSNASGFHRAVLFVRAVTATPSLFYDSPADSGYSVDNLPPVPPAPFTAAYASGAVHLHWGANAESDLWYYKVYRGADASFVPGPGNQIASLADTGYVDPGSGGSYYKLSAVDVNGNESGFVVLQAPGGTTAVGDGAAASFALEPVRPNPAPGSHLVLSFSLPIAAPARLDLLDVSGRRVASEGVGAFGPGHHTVSLSAERIPPGLYLVRLSQAGRSFTRRVTVVQ